MQQVVCQVREVLTKLLFCKSNSAFSLRAK